jgi:hypothetical protein
MSRTSAPTIGSFFVNPTDFDEDDGTMSMGSLLDEQEMRAIAALVNAKSAAARVEVGPSPEQIEAAARAIWNNERAALGDMGDRWLELDDKTRGYWIECGRAALVAACSVRAENTNTED